MNPIWLLPHVWQKLCYKAINSVCYLVPIGVAINKPQNKQIDGENGLHKYMENEVV